MIVGAGQSGLAVGYHLRRSGLRYRLLDAAPAAGGSWRSRWRSLRLFSPAQYSSLPGWMMPPDTDEYPSREHVVDYLSTYEVRYDLPVERPATIDTIRRVDGRFEVVGSNAERWKTRAVVSATGNSPFTPSYPGQDRFAGRQMHSAEYRDPEDLGGQSVLIVGGGNSGAQILAEVSKVADTTWVVQQSPRFMADDVDGRVLFTAATELRRARTEGRTAHGVGGLGDIVMVESVKDARRRGVLHHRPVFERFVPGGVAWADGTFLAVDTVIWCTGFRPRLNHLRDIDVLQPDGTVAVEGTRSVREPRLWLVGYGDWTGFASATLIGVGRTAKQSAREIAATLEPERSPSA